MGPRSSKESQFSFMKDYEVIQQIPTENQTYLQHKETEQEYLLKQFNFNDKKECEKMMEKLAELKTKLSANKHVVPLKEYLMNSEDQYCSTFYKIYALFQYPQRTLDDEINQRNLQRKNFTETQLWSILASCIVGLSHLQKNNIKHSALRSKNILISKQGVIKISDPLSIGQLPNYDMAIQKRSTQHIYLSPQQTQALQQVNISPSLNPYKSDIWTLGMIMLEAGLLEYQDQECYRDQKSRIHWETVQYKIQRLGHAYSDQIKNMVEFMLSKDQRARPDWIDLEQHVMKGGDEVRRSFIKDQQQKTITNGRPVSSQPQPMTTNTGLNRNPDTFIKVATQTPLVGSQNPTPIFTPTATFNPNSSHQNPFPSTITIPTVPFNPTNRAPSPRVPSASKYPQPGSHLHPHNPYSPVPVSVPVSVPVPVPVSVPVPSPGYTLGSGFGGLVVGAQGGLRVSNIEQTRPLINIFPADRYTNKTKFDQNLIMMTEQDESVEQQASNMSYPRQPSHPLVPGPAEQTPQRPPSASKPEYITQQFKMGSRYQGYKQNGLRHGYGKFYYQDGGMYDGEWRDNKMEGFGKLYYQSGKLAYQGTWVNDQFMGRGILYNEIPDLLTHPFNFHNFNDVDEYWTKYDGEFANDMKNGKGVLFLSNGEKFQGNFVADTMEGPGVFYTAKGSRIVGNWANNLKIN